MQDQPIKQQRTRISAYGLVREADRILLCRTSSRVPRWQGWWSLPGGGVDFGEHPEVAMVREVHEETGMRVAAGPVAAVDSLLDESETLELHGIRILYRTRLLGGELRFETNGTTDKCAWFTRGEAAALQLFSVTKLGLRLAFEAARPVGVARGLRQV